MPYKDPEKMKEYREKNKARQREYERKYREKDSRVEYMKDYRKTPIGHKSNKIGSWKKYGIRCDGAWEEVYEWHSCSTNCDICNKPFLTSKDKCLDHDHHLDGYNIRGILCQRCNNHYNSI